MKIECISISSSSDDESDNLSYGEVNEFTENNGDDYAALCENRWVQCEFCDVVFHNRYSLIKHNANHIIIPLIKQTHQCTTCLQHFTSLDNLNTHICKTHIRTENAHIKTEQSQSNEDLLQSIIEKEVIVKCEDDFKDLFRINKVESLKTEYSPENLEEDTARSRLLFEEDEEDFILLNGFNTVQLNQPINSFRDPVKSFDPILSFQKQDSELSNNFQSQQKLEELNQGSVSKNLRVIYTTPIHYDKLMEDEVVLCRFCGKRFPNRFELLKHEPIHMKLRRFRYAVCGYCEKYLAGNFHNLRRHIDEKHPDKSYKKFNLHKCKKCQLYYFNYNKHYDLHHLIYKCKICWKRCEKEEDLNVHKCDINDRLHNHNDKLHNHNDKLHNLNDKLHNHNDRRHNENGNESKSATMKLCELCYSFHRVYIQNRHNYVVMGELSEIGVQQTCDKCNNKFFVVKLVKRESNWKGPHKAKKCLSNADRLKRVQNRLKMIQLRNKF